MGDTLVRVPHPPPQNTNNESGCLVCTIIICGAIWILITTYATAQAISVANYIIWLLLGGGTVLFYIWVVKHKKEERLRQEQAYQAWVQYQFAQRDWINYQIQQEAHYAEQARKEQERREKERLGRLNSLNALLALTPYEFEETVCKLLATYENLHDVKRVGGAGDLAVDIIAYGRANNLIAVQCKKYAPENKIGSPEIQKFIGMLHVHHHTESGIFVTTSTFTQPAIDLAEKHSLFLIDGERLVDMMRTRLAHSY